MSLSDEICLPAENQPGEIRIPLLTLLAPLLLILVIVGWLASPRDASGHPILLTPNVKAVEDYRRQAVGWRQALRLADGEMARILADDGDLFGHSGDLFGRSQEAQGLFEQVLRIAREIDRRSAPPTLFGLREELVRTSTAYLDGMQLTLRWLSSPTVKNATAAQEKLAEGRELLANLEKSQWLTQP